MRQLRFLFLVVITAMIGAGEARAQDRSQITRQIAGAAINIALIERERARPDVPDDFAADALARERSQLSEGYAAADRSGQGRAIRQEAQRRATRLIAAPLRTDYLRAYPDPQRVRADLAAAGDADDAELGGRRAGRFLMLASSLAGLQGNPAYLDENRWPPDVAQRARLYILHHHDIRDHLEPTFTDRCGRLQPWCKDRGQRFSIARGTYQHGLAQAREVAALYFTEAFRERFVDSTGVGGSRRDHAAYQEQLRNDREAAERAREIEEDGVSLSTILPIIGGIALVLILISTIFTRNNKGGSRPSLSDNYGSAAWGAMSNSYSPLDPLRGVFLGKYAFAHHDTPQAKTPPVFTKPQAHTLIMAPTRTGKGTCIIVPTLLRYGGSIVVIDPKGENAAITARQRQVVGPVHVLNPWGVLASDLAERGLAPARYNPLDAIRRDDRDAASIAHTMAETICARSGDPKNAYWEGGATAILTAVFLWLADQGETKTLARARQIVTLPVDKLQREFFIPMAASSAFGGAIAENIGPFLSEDSRDVPSILRTLAEATRFISDERLKEATAESTFDLRTLPHRLESVYLVIPPDKMKIQGTWLRLMLAAAAHAYRTATPRAQGRGMLLIDELPALGRIPDLPTDLATMSGYGLDYTLAVQDLGQLKSIYGEESRTILANCGWKWLCNVRDFDTAKYVSDTLGQRTVGTVNVNEGTTGQGEATSGKAYGEMGRALLTPDEVMQLGRERAIVLPPTGRPFQTWSIDYNQILAEFTAYRETAMQAFYAGPLIIDPNPYYQPAQPEGAAP